MWVARVRAAAALREFGELVANRPARWTADTVGWLRGDGEAHSHQ